MLLARTILLVSEEGITTGSRVLQIGHMYVLSLFLWSMNILLMEVEEKWWCLEVLFMSEHMVHTLSLYLFSLISSASLTLPLAVILGLT